MVPAPEVIERFRRDLDPLIAGDMHLGLAVSGGPDSLALLLLATAARPGLVEAATVDHGLRADSRGEAEMVAGFCEQLGVRHAILAVKWKQKPRTALQERARNARYGMLAGWAEARRLGALATAHHLDDQIETFVMRLGRGAGVQGLAGMRRTVSAPGSDLSLIRPLLGWRRTELEKICADAGVTPVEDPSNADAKFERVRVRQALAQLPEIDVGAIGRSLTYLSQADAALRWAAANEWQRAVSAGGQEVVYCPDSAPLEIRRRIVARAIAGLANEGRGTELRGRELDRVMLALRSGGKATLRGVLCSGGEQWRFIPAPNRTRPRDNLR